MDLIQFISFVMVMLAMSLLSRKRTQEKKQAQYPEEGQEDEHRRKDNLRSFLKSLDADMQEDDLEEEQEAYAPPEPRPAKLRQAPPPPPASQSNIRKEPVKRVVNESSYHLQDKMQQYQFGASLESKQWQTPLESLDRDFTSRKVVSDDLKAASEAYNIVSKRQSSPARRLVQEIPSRKQMILYQEILNPPISLRPPRY